MAHSLIADLLGIPLGKEDKDTALSGPFSGAVRFSYMVGSNWLDPPNTRSIGGFVKDKSSVEEKIRAKEKLDHKLWSGTGRKRSHMKYGSPY